MHTMTKKWLFAALTALVMILVLWAYSASRSKPNPLMTAAVRQGDIENVIAATGKMDAIERVNVGAQVSGQVKKLYIKAGDNVRKGQLIAEIDDQPQRSDLRNAQAALSVAQADLQTRQATLVRQQAQFQRLQQMVKTNAVSRQDFDTAAEAWRIAQAELTAQQARVIQAQIEVDKKQLDLGYTRIMAPIDGTVVAIVTKQGQTVNAVQSAPTIAKLAQLGTMTIKVQISEADITNIQPGQQAWFTTFANPDKRYNATLRSIELAPESVMKDDALMGNSESNTVSSTNAAVYYNALLDVPNPDNALRISMTAQVNLLRDQAKNALLVPVQATKKASDGRTYVEIADQNNQPEKRYITTGISDSVDIQVLSGLRLGEKVILATQQPGADKVVM
ncbi:MAG: efflux RND transporter periplasmic adaptor subunit [Pantoea sp. Morm]|jgi:macrolide-specific efflux system membrane fusion protein|uniref:Efflux RND transporter periplasmic adaptor subunit n=1 Tax=Pantoea dispersa TaxID=59814 RepID=A0ABY3A0W2_9GAMM|nr:MULTISPECIES: efflux RND transporter periplasmic adaptor subunit [Pantoea]MBK4772026.1 efflux RND transporter periplasmic adaptor subunit [Pantoea sp. Morm]KAA8674016.1 efflux RND transporter periplasmic adaptor subunit [Pantoea dispersa]MBU6519836.1 efflux RND transporter periplasmic adaptor subunit [Pantoea sp. B270]MBZ6391925.1 efflux RND transporter periplasmic adaptor subunit [Pantoea dispersa]TQC75814.1 efflux RND transporter periplasmic adaptor subunit [Pantoea dispersa]